MLPNPNLFCFTPANCGEVPGHSCGPGVTPNFNCLIFKHYISYNRKFGCGTGATHKLHFFRNIHDSCNKNCNIKLFSSLEMFIFSSNNIGNSVISANNGRSNHLTCYMRRMNFDWKWPEGFVPLTGSRSMVCLSQHSRGGKYR